MIFDPTRAAYALIDARKTGHSLEQLPEGSQPTSEAEAYAIQDIVAKTFDSVVAWKVGSATPNSEPSRAHPPRHAVLRSHFNSSKYVPRDRRRSRNRLQVRA